MQEISIDYSHCTDLQNNTDYETIPSKYTASSFKGSSENCTTESKYQWKTYSTERIYAPGTAPVVTPVCSLQFNIPDNLHAPVLLYYRLTNFYQNHRRYVKSLVADQLKGTAVSNNSLGSCDPLNTDKDGKPYYPCGLIANSLFNDTIANPIQLNPHYSNAQNVTYNMTEEGIAWSSDASLYGTTKYKYEDIAVPPNWHLRYQNGYSDDAPPPDLKTDYQFQVWMRTAGLPNFSKLAKRNDNETMLCSMYQVDIDSSRFAVSGLLCYADHSRFSCDEVRGYQVVGHFNPNRDGRKESFSWDCVRGRGRHMHCPWHSIYNHTPHQT